MTIEFTVVGENREEPSQFLVIGADGHYYGYDPAREQISPIEPDGRWEMLPSTEGALSEPLPIDF